MTVSAELQKATGAHRRVFVKVEGHREIFWQDFDYAEIDGTFTGRLRKESADPPGPHPTSDPSLVALWPLDELNASAGAEDFFGNHDGTATGTPPLGTGQFAGSRDFGAGHYFTVTGDADFQLSAFTISLWCYPDSTTQNAFCKLFYQESTTPDWSFAIECPNPGTSAVEFGIRTTSGATVVQPSTGNLSASAWHHVVATYDGTTMYLYHDGVQVGTSTVSEPVLYDSSPANLLIGSDVGGGATNWDGRLCDVAIYRGAKSAAWVRRMYANRSYARRGINCLTVPDDELSRELNLGTMEPRWSSLALKLQNSVVDPLDRTKRYFSKIFAPGRWSQTSAGYSNLVRKDAADDQLDANATTVYIKNSNSISSTLSGTGGYLWIGKEAISYTATSTTAQTGYTRGTTIRTLTGVTKGIWPAFSDPRGAGADTRGYTYKYPRNVDDSEGDTGDNMIVTNVPISWIGREVGVYVTAWDYENAQWFSEANATLVWAGQINDSVAYDPDTDTWTLQCASLFESLQTKVEGYPFSSIKHINLKGTSTSHRTFTILHIGYKLISLLPHPYFSTATITVDAGYYTPQGLVDEINDKIATASWSTTDHDRQVHLLEFVLNRNANNCTIQIIHRSSQAANDDHSYFFQGQQRMCHALQALGFKQDLFCKLDQYWGEVSGEDYYTHYHPFDHRFNGGKMLLDTNQRNAMWSDQGDHASAIAYGMVRDAKIDGVKDGAYIFGYTAVTETGVSVIQPQGKTLTKSSYELTLADDSAAATSIIPRLPGQGVLGFVGSTKPDERPQIRNVYHPTHLEAGSSEYKVRGPFAHLLRMLESSGVSSYNGTYDVLPVELGAAFPSSLINEQSFLDADQRVSEYTALIDRPLWIEENPISWWDVFMREAKLFGCTIAFDNSQLRIKWPLNPDFAETSTTPTLNDSNTADSRDYPEVLQSLDTVVNQYEFELGWDHHTKKYFDIWTISDRVSQGVLRTTKGVSLKHPGIITQGAETATTRSLVDELIRDRMPVLGLPQQVFTRTLAPTLFNRIFVGDVVSVSHSYKHPDAFGTGNMSVTGTAIVLDVAWNLSTYVGVCTLLLWSKFGADRVAPWAPAALVDITASNGGWNSGTQALTLVARAFGRSGDNHDGEAFAVGDNIIIRERSPSNPASPATGPWAATVDGSYSTGSGVLLLSVSTLTGYDTTGETEYIITYDDWDTVVTAQQLLGIWGANAQQEDLGAGSDAPFFWG